MKLFENETVAGQARRRRLRDGLELVGPEEEELQTGECGEGVGEVVEDDNDELLEGMVHG